MRLLLLLIPSLALLAQAPVHKVSAAPSTGVKNYKESGSPNAPITLELYTDFQCPSCRNFYLNVLPSVMTEYVASGKVRLIHRDFPLPIPAHVYNRVAARYADAAGQLGSYELVAMQIFKTQPEWDGNGNVDAEVAKVVAPGQMQKIRELVKNDPHLEDAINADVALGNQEHINETPSMIIVVRGKRQKISGPVEWVVLKAYLDQLLKG
jgi:protein-disulfide isomerase